MFWNLPFFCFSFMNFAILSSSAKYIFVARKVPFCAIVDFCNWHSTCRWIHHNCRSMIYIHSGTAIARPDVFSIIDSENQFTIVSEMLVIVSRYFNSKHNKSKIWMEVWYTITENNPSKFNSLHFKASPAKNCNLIINI